MKYRFTYKKACKISNNTDLLKEEATEMHKCFEKQGNQAHSLEGSHIFSRAVFLEKVFYEQLIPIYQHCYGSN